MNYTDIHRQVDVPITLLQTNLLQDYEGDFNTRRVVISTLQFVAKTYVFNKLSSYQGITSYVVNFDINGITFDMKS
jgi:hypothetical protein